ncbi:MAG: glycerate kinase [Desulfovibrio sp.]|nr:glycerate kinase [Desulfovibrio sp.]
MEGDARKELREIFDAGVAAVAPDAALLAHMKLSNGALEAGGKVFPLTNRKIYVCGAGKGAAPMAAALENLIGALVAKGVIVVKYGHQLPLNKFEIFEASHPVPDEAGEKGAAACLETAKETGPEDLLICLFTGGASALLPLPYKGLNLDDLKKASDLLLASGATINEMNAVRKHLSAISGGRLAATAKGEVLSVIVSDVVGDDLSTIASGPTAPDPSTFADCLYILEKYRLTSKFPPDALKILRTGADGKIPETPKPGSEALERTTNIIVASNALAVKAAAERAERLGYRPSVMNEPMTGEAKEVAARLVEIAKEEKKSLKSGDKGICILAGGETTVRIMGDGRGGRNQEMALAAAIDLDGSGGVAGLFAGTDGTDGPTDAAGGFAFPDTVGRIGSKIDALKYLANNDSNPALAKAGDLLVTGPTRTNVMDLAIILIQPRA